MNLRRLTLALVIALCISGLCTYAIGRKMKANSGVRVADRRYVAPARAIQAGEMLKADNLMLVDWPATNPVAGSFTKLEDLIGRALLYPMEKGQPITEKFLTAIGAGVGLAGRIPDGMRAIALRSDEVMGVAGFLLPGSHLDVLVTYRTDRTPEPATLTVLQDAEVLAAGHQIQPDPEGKPATVTVVTLLLTPTDAERVVLASTQGTIHFVLRSGSDKTKTHTAPTLLSQLSGVPANGAINNLPHVSDHLAIRRPLPKQYVVETIMGDKQTTNTFEGAPQK
jgi:pilus assembly protein CpaB